VDSWVAVMLGQRIVPEQYHPVTQGMSDEDLVQLLSELRATVSQDVSRLPTQADFIARYCKADASVWI